MFSTLSLDCLYNKTTIILQCKQVVFASFLFVDLKGS